MWKGVFKCREPTCSNLFEMRMKSSKEESDRVLIDIKFDTKNTHPKPLLMKTRLSGIERTCEGNEITCAGSAKKRLNQNILNQNEFGTRKFQISYLRVFICKMFEYAIFELFDVFIFYI